MSSETNSYEPYKDSPPPAAPPELVRLSPSPPVSNDHRKRSNSLILNMEPAESSDSSIVDNALLEAEKRKQIYRASAKMAAVFFASFAILALVLYFSWPEIEDADKPSLRIPKSFEQLQALNALLKKYRNQQGLRILISWTVIYLFLQAFSLPGSMYLSMLAGAVWGAVPTLPLVCCTVATGASLCYLISASLGAVLLSLPPTTKSKDDTNYRHLRLESDAEPFLLNEEAQSPTLQAAVREEHTGASQESEEKLNWFDSFRLKLEHYQNKMKGPIERGDVWSYLILLRIAPLPPHWVLNLVAPHMGISLFTFWGSTALGVAGVSTIHVTIGSGLDGMTSSDDFHLFSIKNFLGLGAVVLAALIPIAIKHAKKKDLDSLAGIDGEQFVSHPDDNTNSDYPPSYHPTRKNSLVKPPHAAAATAHPNNRSRSSSRSILLDSTPSQADHKRNNSTNLSPVPPDGVKMQSSPAAPSPQLIMLGTPPPLSSPELINFDQPSTQQQRNIFANSFSANNRLNRNNLNFSGKNRKNSTDEHPLTPL
ncbi:hypothetical protein E3P92_02039 [Wallemia ichthyophaga]|uniref:Transmembrane protein 41B n=1 Tax=Wallemia ichthyophaga (strain EXF-994 / CBS 113033) TaxID=1299270 RepID=R9ACN5_WALI9|nr:Transmembrane protein 41B [Wallemia ichthyophaga EXF-994]TIA72069.1 hypothetical protein E3P91_02204 [Wallemia ichthyophaga]EOQ99844.1 Transmembrane protein 41B [Wallemia ichthyophaga EXF-994]TIA84511.1 hypothetical protein E3P98_00057 [Wallemia ichthyophaga]TIA93990.1 hypothetical protein E3P97_00485 [Wallemia ichthyophaga]TIB04396.1 hypothetical protein E3P95_00292 [Wallemia ichthyophaga]